MCRPHPFIEAMMDHITVNGKELTKIKRLSPSHVTINKCIGKQYIYETSEVCGGPCNPSYWEDGI